MQTKGRLYFRPQITAIDGVDGLECAAPHESDCATVKMPGKAASGVTITAGCHGRTSASIPAFSEEVVARRYVV